MTELNEEKLHAFVGKMLGDLGGANSVPTVRIGLKLGLFKALHEGGPATSTELAERTGLAERYVREWAYAQASSGYVDYDPAGFMEFIKNNCNRGNCNVAEYEFDVGSFDVTQDQIELGDLMMGIY